MPDIDLDNDTTQRGVIKSGLITGSHMVAGLNQMPALRPSADWEELLPVFEPQRQYGFESDNCVQFSFLSTAETLSNYHRKPFNLSDRFLYWASGCTEDGNTFENCYLGFKRNGAPPEERWPWPVGLTDRKEYGKTPPDDVRNEAYKLFDEWTVKTPQYVGNDLDDMKLALTKGPLWIANSYHATMVYRIDDRIRVFDTYLDEGDGRGSYSLGYAPNLDVYLLNLTPKAVPMPDNKLPIPQFARVTVVFPHGLHRFFFKDGKMMYDGEASNEVNDAWLDNNVNPITHVFQGGPALTISKDDWEKFETVNFKGEPYPYPIV